MPPRRPFVPPLGTDGTHQGQRTPPALEPGYVAPDERSLSDLVEQARLLAAEIRFYGPQGRSVGDWGGLLAPLLDPATGRALPPAALRETLEARGDWPPHLALFAVFLELFQHLQDDLGELPTRHLRHYYGDLLRLERRAPTPDRVHAIFELAKQAAPTLIPAGTALDAGKDSAGRPRVYTIENDLVVGPGRVVDIRRLVADTTRTGQRVLLASDSVAESEGDGWHTFGRRELGMDPSRRFMTEARRGFAVASPALRLAEGERTVTLRMELRHPSDGPPLQNLTSGLALELTGTEGWLAPEYFEARLVGAEGGGGPGDNGLALELDLHLSEAAPSVVDFDPELHGGGPAAPWPVLRCRLSGDSGLGDILGGLEVVQSSLAVEVRGVRDLVVHGDRGPLQAGGTSLPFGPRPRNGEHLYIGSAEALAKGLTSLALHLEWQEPPDDLFEHYRAYFDFVDEALEDSFRQDFTATLALRYDRRWLEDLPRQNLFGYPSPAANTIRLSAAAFQQALGGATFEAQPQIETLGPPGPRTPFGFLRLTLEGPSYRGPFAEEAPFDAFGHSAFSRRYAAAALALARWTPDLGVPEPVLPNEPYTPTLVGLSLDYTAEVRWRPGDPHSDGEHFVLGPWGHTTAGGDVPAGLTPAFEGEAALHLGIEGLAPPANLSLLFQIDPGTAEGATVLADGETEWSVLAGDTWLPLPPTSVLADDTRGFQQPGLVTLAIDGDATVEHTAMPAGRVWLRAAIPRPPESAARTLAVRAQAALATFAPPSSGLDEHGEHLGRGLEADSIRRPVRRNAAIQAVQQPYPSTGGRGPETDGAYFRRVSERLRHRRRGVTPWDVERLVLEAFPEIFKVKCLPHSDAEGNDRPGEVAVVVVPDLRSAPTPQRLEPRAGAVLLHRVEGMLDSGLSSPFRTLHVIRPVFERLRVDARVAFADGLDAGFFAQKLNEDLRRFLSPWAFEEGEDIAFGARIYRSEILAFMEGRDYVDHILDAHLFHNFDGPPRGGVGRMEIGRDFVVRPDPSPAVGPSSAVGQGVDGGMVIGDTFVVGRGVEAAEATRPHAILVSHPEHRITPITPSDEPCTGFHGLGIGALAIGLDFDVHIA